jgi:hypothetical protein
VNCRKSTPLQAKREIAVGNDNGMVLGRELAVTAGMIAMQMGVDDVLDRLATACLIDGRLDLVVQRREFRVHLDDRVTDGLLFVDGNIPRTGAGCNCSPIRLD